MSLTDSKEKSLISRASWEFELHAASIYSIGFLVTKRERNSDFVVHEQTDRLDSLFTAQQVLTSSKSPGHASQLRVFTLLTFAHESMFADWSKGLLNIDSEWSNIHVMKCGKRSKQDANVEIDQNRVQQRMRTWGNQLRRRRNFIIYTSPFAWSSFWHSRGWLELECRIQFDHNPRLSAHHLLNVGQFGIP